MGMSDDATSNERESVAKRSAARSFIEAGGRISPEGRRKSETTGPNIDERLDKSWVIGGKVGVGHGMDRVRVAKDGPTDAKFTPPQSMPAQFVHKAESVVERTITPIPLSAAASEMYERDPAMSSAGMNRTLASCNSSHSLSRSSSAAVTAPVSTASSAHRRDELGGRTDALQLITARDPATASVERRELDVLEGVPRRWVQPQETRAGTPTTISRPNPDTAEAADK